MGKAVGRFGKVGGEGKWRSVGTPESVPWLPLAIKTGSHHDQGTGFGPNRVVEAADAHC